MFQYTSLTICFFVIVSCSFATGQEGANPFQNEKDLAIEECQQQLMEYEYDPNLVEPKSVYQLRDDNELPYDWRDCQNCPFFGQSITETDVQQFRLGDCWFLATVSRLLLNGLRDVEIVRRPGLERAFGFILYPNMGKPTCVVVDRLLPYSNGKPKFVNSPHLVVNLLEKAAAQAYGGYRALDNGTITEGFFLLTGRTCKMYSMCQPNQAETSNDDFCIAAQEAMEEIVINEHNSDSYLFGNIRPGYKTFKNNELRDAHAYAVFDKKEVNGHSYLKIYETSREAEWGKWHPYSGLEYPMKFTFYMLISDFLKNFSEFYACERNPEKAFQSRFNGNFLKVILDTSGAANSFRFRVHRRQNVQISLLQYHPRNVQWVKEAHNRYPVVLGIYEEVLVNDQTEYKFVRATCLGDLFYNSLNKELHGTYLAIPYSLAPLTNRFYRDYPFNPEYAVLFGKTEPSLQVTEVSLPVRVYWKAFIDYGIATHNLQKSYCIDGCEGEHFIQVYGKAEGQLYVYIIYNPTELNVQVDFRITYEMKNGKDESEVSLGRDTKNVLDVVPPNTIYMVNFAWNPGASLNKISFTIPTCKSVPNVVNSRKEHLTNFVLFSAGSTPRPSFIAYSGTNQVRQCRRGSHVPSCPDVC